MPPPPCNAAQPRPRAPPCVGCRRGLPAAAKTCRSAFLAHFDTQLPLCRLSQRQLLDLLIQSRGTFLNALSRLPGQACPRAAPPARLARAHG